MTAITLVEELPFAVNHRRRAGDRFRVRYRFSQDGTPLNLSGAVVEARAGRPGTLLFEADDAALTGVTITVTATETVVDVDVAGSKLLAGSWAFEVRVLPGGSVDNAWTLVGGMLYLDARGTV